MGSEQLSRGAWRLEIECGLQWSGPLHVGAGGSLSAVSDSPLLRDAGGRAWLPGSSVRGVMRDWCEREACVAGVDGEAVKRLFGWATPSEQKEQDRQGRLSVLDARVVDGTTEISDHVRLCAKWGAAVKGGKFDQEIARPRTATLRLLYEGDGPRDPEVRLLRSALGALSDGALAFGGKTGWGQGAVRAVTVRSRTHDRTAAGLGGYLLSRLPDGGGDGWSEGLPVSSVAAPVAVDSGPSAAPAPYCWMRLDLRLPFDGPMLVSGLQRNVENHEQAVDHSFQVDLEGNPILPGSSLRGVLRSHAFRIARTLGPACEDVATRLFGSIKRGENAGRVGLVRIGEGRLPDGERHHEIQLQHVAVDRITGFSAGKRLFDARALASPRFDVRIVTRWTAGDPLDEAAVGLLLFVLRDASEGLLWVGSRTTRGYGHLKPIEVRGALVSSARESDGRWARERREASNIASLSDLAVKLGLTACIERWVSEIPEVEHG